MTTLFVFASTLLLATLVSDLANRSVLSTAALFLCAGFLAGPGMFGVMPFLPDAATGRFAQVALFAVLFTDGMRLDVGSLRRGWRVPGRALLLGLPLALAITAVLAHFVLGLSWPAAWLVAAVLSPTDPVFASALVGREGIPASLQRLLNVESGVNDGLALPLVIVFLAGMSSGDVHAGPLIAEVLGGIGLGVALPWVAARIERSRFFSVGRRYEPMFAFSVGLLLFATASLSHANEYLAAFAGGMTMASTHGDLAEAFEDFGHSVAELLKLAALLVFGSMMSVEWLRGVRGPELAFTAAALLVARPVGLGLALVGSPIRGRERAAALWFGPKGFASVVFGLLVLHSGVPGADRLFHVAALVVTVSILAHSSTDVVVARRLRTRLESDEAPERLSG